MTFFWKLEKKEMGGRQGRGIFFIFCHIICHLGIWYLSMVYEKIWRKALFHIVLTYFSIRLKLGFWVPSAPPIVAGIGAYVLDGKKVNDMMRVWVWIWFFWRWRRDKNIIIIGGRDTNIEKSGVIIIYYQSANFFFMSNASILVGERVTETWVPGTHSTA